MESLIVRVPGMLPSEKPLPEGVVLFDPGSAPGEGRFRPANLPMDETAAKAWLHQALAYADGFKKPGELAAMGSRIFEDFFRDTAAAIRNEIREYEAPKAEEAQQVLLQQRILLTAKALEERHLESNEADGALDDMQENLRSILGVDEDDEADLRHLITSGLADLVASPSIYGESEDLWRRVLQAQLAFLPPEAILFVDEAEIVKAWEDEGLEFKTPDAEAVAELGIEDASGAYRMGTFSNEELVSCTFLGSLAGNEQRTVIAAVADE